MPVPAVAGFRLGGGSSVVESKCLACYLASWDAVLLMCLLCHQAAVLPTQKES